MVLGWMGGTTDVANLGFKPSLPGRIRWVGWGFPDEEPWNGVGKNE